MKLRKLLFFIISSALISLLGCSTDNSSGSSNEEPDFYPTYESSRSISLEKIYNPNVLGESTVTIKRSEWNKLLQYYDWWAENETSVKASFTFSKNDETYNFDNINFRIRGNTSRVRPQQKNGDKYRQAHFKISFKDDNNASKDDPSTQSTKIKGMKGMNLKRFRNDPSYVGEVFSYNYFRQNGVWTAPRAAYTKLSIKIVEDDGSEETINYGIYEMIEEINAQFLKERTEENTGGQLKSSDGNLWKCAWAEGTDGTWYGASMLENNASMGVENKEFTDDLGHYTSETFTYDLKTNKESLVSAKEELQNFIHELNNLKNGSAQTKDWLSKHMDVKFFLKTYAINVILGMWDDYWTNMNNYYFYFDPNNYAYFIPYDYDNVLNITTANCNADPIYRDPFEWGYCYCSEGSKPLIEKILSISEYKNIYCKYLKELVNGELYENAGETIQKYQNLISQYTYSNQLAYIDDDTEKDDKDNPYSDTTKNIDYTAQKIVNEYFIPKKEAILAACSNLEKTSGSIPDGIILPCTYNAASDLLTFTFNPSDYNLSSCNFTIGDEIFVRGWFTVIVEGGYFYSWNINSDFKMNYNPYNNCYSLQIEKTPFNWYINYESEPTNHDYKFYNYTRNEWYGLAELSKSVSKYVKTGYENGNFRLPE